MKSKTVKVKYDNKVNPASAFDLVNLQELFTREHFDHNPENLHKVDFFIVLLITAGKGRHTIDFTDYEYEKGSLFTIRKDQIHKFHKRKNTKGYLLIFKEDFLVSYLEKLETQKTLQLFNEQLGAPKIQLSKGDFEIISTGISRMEEEYLQRKDDYSLGIIRSELHILITKLYRIKSKKEQMVVGKRYLSAFIAFQELAENNVSKTTRVSDYAKMISVSTKTLNTISKSIVNKSAKEFIDEINTKQIKRLLINTSLSIKEVAYAAGFEESTNFYKYFKRQVDMTPEQFRASF